MRLPDKCGRVGYSEPLTKLMIKVMKVFV